MGCNCKSKVNKKYTDGKDNGRENRSYVGVFFHKILNVLMYLLVAVFAILLVIPAIFFIFIKRGLGKEASIKLSLVDKIKKTEKNARTKNI